MRRYCV
jgi:hypothetical protein